MWIDQRERNSKSGWLWGSVLFHAGIATYFIMSNSPEHSPLPMAGAASETITMTVTESKGAEKKEAAPAAEPVNVKEEKLEVVKVAAPKKVAKKTVKPKAKKQAKVTALPKKEVLPEQLDAKIEEPKNDVKGVVIPVTEEPQETEETVVSEEAVEAEEAQVVQEEAAVEAAPVAALPAKQESAPPQQPGNEQANTPAGGGTSSNPRSYLDLKQKEGNVPPRYPDVARKQGLQGQVQLKYFVAEDGMVSNVQVMKSSGSSLLDKEAVDAIQQYQYHPGQAGWAQHPVSFSLKGPQQQTPGRLRTARGN